MRAAQILLIEDDSAFAALVQESLEASGYQVTRANDSDEGFALARKNSYDVLLTDFSTAGRERAGHRAQAARGEAAPAGHPDDGAPLDRRGDPDHAARRLGLPDEAVFH